ncbi:hypothetical protein [Glutamicibacter arilaitensis]|uniref:hypothetical protein n=1 Tax=Glutamicibacter arilaitensis TaxID=256701 RepID=UPI003F991E2A
MNDQPSNKSAADDALRARFARVRLLNQELDVLGADATDRATSIANKASFLAVSAGVIVAASVAQLWTALPIFGAAALSLAFIALLCASVALRPGKRKGIEARRLVDLNIDSSRSALQLEAQLVQNKADVLAEREPDLQARASWVWKGFASLTLSSGALTIVFSAQILGG